MSSAERFRLRMRHWRAELGRTIDCLATREDVDATPAAQQALSELLGTPSDQKKQVLFEAGHGNLPRFQVEKDTLDWFERQLGSATP
jgi:hypothetical protein